MDQFGTAKVGCARCWFVFVLSSTSPTEEDTGEEVRKEEVVAVLRWRDGSGDLIGRRRKWKRRVEILYEMHKRGSERTCERNRDIKKKKKRKR